MKLAPKQTQHIPNEMKKYPGKVRQGGILEGPGKLFHIHRTSGGLRSSKEATGTVVEWWLTEEASWMPTDPQLQLPGGRIKRHDTE